MPWTGRGVMMINRQNFNISAYLVIGPENTRNRPVTKIIKDAINSGFTCIQIRSKVASAKELIQLTKEAAELIASLGKSNEVMLVVNDRLDVILAARKQGIKVDGIHVGQTDIPIDVCREYLGEAAIIGLSAKTYDLLNYVQSIDAEEIDYFGAGPLHETSTKPDCGLDLQGNFHKRTMDELEELVRVSPLPIVVGGGVKLADIASLHASGVAGFFVVSAVTEADDPKQAALELVHAWNKDKVSKDLDDSIQK